MGHLSNRAKICNIVDKGKVIVMKQPTEKQIKFIEALVAGASKRDAYRAAYATKNMNPKTIDKRAFDLLKNPVVKGWYDKVQKNALEKIQESQEFTAKTTINKYVQIANADIGNYLVENGKDRQGRKKYSVNLENTDTSAIKSLRFDKDTGHITYLEMYSKMDALKVLAEITGAINAANTDNDIKIVLEGDAGEYAE